MFHLSWLWLPSAEMAVARVRERVRMGGHDVPPEVVRRRYRRGLHNLFDLYLPIADDWRFYDNSHPTEPRLVAAGGRERPALVTCTETWRIAREGGLRG